MFGIRAVGISRLTSIAGAVVDYTKSLILSLKGDSVYNKNINTTILDRSVNDLAITTSGTLGVNSFSPFSSTWSYYFDGAGDYLSVPRNAAFFPAANTDFTIEAWVFLTATPGATNAQIIGTGEYGTDADWVLSISSGLVAQIYIQSTNVVYTGGTITLNTWNHIAVSRSGTGANNLKVFVNGVGTTYSVNNTLVGVGSRALTIGADQDGDESNLTGYISNARIVNGTAVYTANFTPPTAALSVVAGTSLLTCHSGRLFDASAGAADITVAGNTSASTFGPFAQTALTGSVGSTSVYFNGSNNYLTAPSLGAQPALALGSNDFTMEGWVFLPDNASGGTQFYWNGDSNSYAAVRMLIGTDGVTLLMTTTTNTWTINTSVSNSLGGGWNHIALTRSGTAIKIYINGVGTSVGNISGSLLAGTSNWIGRMNFTSAPQPFKGYMSNVRIIVGSALYTADFAPPTADLTAVSGTALLTCQGGSISDSSSNNYTITNVNSARVSSANPFTTSGGWSAYFDGTGDYLTVARNAAFFPAANTDFTIEAWVYLTATPGATNAQIIGTGEYGTDADWVLSISSGLVAQIYIQSTNVTYTGGAVPLNSWNHIAVSRSGTGANNLKVFVNGVGTSYSVNNTLVGVGSRALTIGADQDGDESNLTGYISNARIVNGSALYTANFTPPTAALSVVANTALLTLQSNTFKDNSSNAFTVTNAGDVTVRATGPFTTSTVFPGSLTLQTSTYANTAASAALNVLGGDFTIECWFNPSTFENIHYILCNDYRSGTASGNFRLQSETSGVVTFRTYGTNLVASAITLSSARTIKLGAWNHIAVAHVRSTNTTRLFLNGALEASSTTATWAGATLAATIGVLGQPGGTSYGSGASAGRLLFDLAGVRMIKGTALYTTAFTPPSSPPSALTGTVLLLNFNDGGIVDTYGSSSTKNMVLGANPTPPLTSNVTKKFGTGSIAFDNNGHIITGGNITGVNTSPPEFIFGTGDFTIELWVNSTASGSRCLYDGRPFGGAGAYVALFLTGNPQVVTLTVNSVAVITTRAVILNAWTHVALVRSSGVTRIYLDGIQSGSSWSDSTDYLNAPTGRPWIGQSSNANYFAGCLDDVRVYKGAAKYTSTFLPVENADTIATPSSFSWSMAGVAGDALTAASTSALALGTGDFTMEVWINVNANNTGYVTIINCNYGTSSAAIQFGNSGYGYKLQACMTSASTATVWSCAVLQTSILGTWTHIAFTRQGGVCRLFVNGVVQNINSGANPSTYPYTSFTDTTSVGNASLSVGSGLNGFITDARIIKGTALYTTSFTPPTAKLTAVAGTAVLTAQNATAIDNSPNALAITAGGNARATTTYYKY